MNDTHNYSANKQRAIAEMLEMNKRATKRASASKITTNKSFTFGLDPDVMIILVIMLIIYNDQTDFLLILALAYILI